ncbi:hypothetical protein [Cellvibrio japonicus]|uniref:Conserved domain protein n=1 Tax=Cellvibrio japonicus (strain Ueda107) TaxID=498211 RepID=B3PIQ9_CELJU|nr:hypothetical protein [Cellvibrio japonicus]ACE83331.1 conserved domain protein [Cellvibrio japonicus Ueda107]QEI13973.1 hypothetical protein FY117_18270 [Cellvibrio japonicus]QEI17547.1 hypothetical protein FY116_18275 [Cellvibrio japonicus]QEI21123.1 hypothetical protein FY115_18270 [Cellvibrio japonicus]
MNSASENDLIVSTFYDSFGDSLVDSSNFSNDIESYLVLEDKMVNSILGNGNYSCLVEVGCMEGRSIYLAESHQISYCGIDIVKRYIEKANIAIRESKIEKHGHAKLLSAYDLNFDTVPELLNKSCLVYFPFNCFGNIPDFKRIKNVICNLNADIFISTYQTNACAHRARSDYYKKSGYSEIQCNFTDEGVRFSSKENLNTIAYELNFLLESLNVNSRKVTIYDEGKIFRGIYIQAPSSITPDFKV